jgi:hypothetical protein
MVNVPGVIKLSDKLRPEVMGGLFPDGAQLESAQFAEAVPTHVSVAASAWGLKPKSAKSARADATPRRAISGAIRNTRAKYLRATAAKLIFNIGERDAFAFGAHWMQGERNATASDAMVLSHRLGCLLMGRKKGGRKFNLLIDLTYYRINALRVKGGAGVLRRRSRTENARIGNK